MIREASPEGFRTMPLVGGLDKAEMKVAPLSAHKKFFVFPEEDLHSLVVLIKFRICSYDPIKSDFKQLGKKCCSII